MADWIAKLDDFLKLSDRDILTHAGKVSHQLAEEHAHVQFAAYDERRRLEAAEPASGDSDFDKAVGEVKRLEQPAPPAKPKKPGRKKKGSGQ